ncbi:hypothetical protein F511_28861 [Dorcoceras hygrometricum]|uniref:Uncharacterized protein n=1 Tax=Dorcoceras hygrometricum TaxID=472368 RepID=A0A2Z7C150_9LAMI|nr:hypothetical protein F511_28861 [Dorcoceras hygrometricum]
MGCPGQARTKPRSKLAVATLPETSPDGGRRHHVTCGARPHACRNACGPWRVMRQPVAHPAVGASSGRNQQPPCTEYGAHTGHDVTQPALPQRPASVPQSCGQRATRSRPSRDQHEMMSGDTHNCFEGSEPQL